MTDLNRAIEMADLLQRQKARMDQLKDDLEDAKKDYVRTAQTDLPELFRELGITELALAPAPGEKKGKKIVVTPEVATSIKKDNQPEAFAWLRKNGFGGLIKTVVTIGFDPDEIDTADQVAEEMLKRYDTDHVGMSETIHAATLKSFVKEQMEEGNNLPDCITVFPYDLAKVE